jgi:hypothetical protein
MRHFSEAAVERAMKVQEVILRAAAKRLFGSDACSCNASPMPDQAILLFAS